jgi:hypothetical protein
VRRREQAVDELRPRLGTFVGDERVDLGERRRQADQVERDAADQRRAVGARLRLEPRRALRRREQFVDRRSATFDRGPHRRRVGPVRRGLLRSAQHHGQRQRRQHGSG